jgi:hypothetical protein
MLIEVIGQISWQDVKKFESTRVWPLSEPRVKVLPALSTSGIFKTLAGTGELRNEPPSGAAAPWPTASGGLVGLLILACAAVREEREPTSTNERANLIELFNVAHFPIRRCCNGSRLHHTSHAEGAPDLSDAP